MRINYFLIECFLCVFWGGGIMNTPAYIFSAKEISRCYEAMQMKMPEVKIHYALKANSEIEILQVLKQNHAYFEVASEGEYNKLLKIRVPAERIICGLPIKPTKWIRSLYGKGCRYFVFDLISELMKIKRIAPESKKILRININDLVPESIDFGMGYDIILANLKYEEFKSSIDGLSFHISNNIDSSKLNVVLDRIDQLLSMMPQRHYILNIGGGYRLNAAEDFYNVLNWRISKLKSKYNLEIYAEPGNSIVNSAGVVRTSVVGVRQRKENQYDLYIDAGKPTGIKTDEKRIPTYIKLLSKTPICEQREYRFVDITCMHKPHFSIQLCQEVREGDIFEFGGMGAYTVCLQSEFHAWESPKVVVE